MSVPRPNTAPGPVSTGNFTPGRGAPISQITFHHIVGDAPSALAMFANARNARSANYVIHSNGTIYAVVPESDTAWCDGNWESNQRTISIEHAGGHPSVPYSEAMYDASARLCAYLIDRYGITNFKRHRDVSSSPTACPGGLDVERILARARELLNPPAPPAPPPAPAPPNVTIRYERLPAPLELQYNKDCNLWGLGATAWRDFVAVEHFRRGDRLQAFGIAHHPLGGKYYMRSFDFVDADTTGIPKFNVGVNVADTEPFVAPVPVSPAPLPAPVPTPPSEPPQPPDDPPASPSAPGSTPGTPAPETPTSQQPGTQVSLLRRVLQFILHLLTSRMRKI